MTKEKELTEYLNKNVFYPILKSDASPKIKSGVNLTISRMGKLSAEKMVQYFWSALAKDNSINFSKRLKAEGHIRFEDVLEEFRDKFNDEWLK